MLGVVVVAALFGGSAGLAVAAGVAVAGPLTCSGFAPSQVDGILAETAGSPPDPTGYYAMSGVTLQNFPSGCDGDQVGLAFYGNATGDPGAATTLLGTATAAAPRCGSADPYSVSGGAVDIPLCPGTPGLPDIMSFETTSVVWTVSGVTGIIGGGPGPIGIVSAAGGSSSTTTSTMSATTTTTSGSSASSPGSGGSSGSPGPGHPVVAGGGRGTAAPGSGALPPASVSVKSTGSPKSGSSSQLPFTGSDAAELAGAAVGLLALGLGALWLRRRATAPDRSA